MEQVYWLSRPLEPGTDTRMLVYRYGSFVYAGAVITEPLGGLEHLPGILQGIQAVQGQVPYVCEHKDLPEDSPHRKSLRALEAAIDIVHAEVAAMEPRLAALAEEGATWLDDDDAALYFEFEARPGFTCNKSDVVFAKSYREDVLLTCIWYGPTGSLYVSLSPAGGEEQALVDTLFPSIYGRRRGVGLNEYTVPLGLDGGLGRGEGRGEGRGGVIKRPYNGALPVDTVLAALREYEEGADGDGGDSKTAERAAAVHTSGGVLPPWMLFQKVSVWEASEPVPDPDAVRERDELEAGLDELAAALEMETKLDESAVDISQLSDAGPVVDISGGSGYTQVYAVMNPAPGSSTATARHGLVPRAGLFRFGDWVYAGVVEFPVDALRLGDVPNVLPTLQKQQGRLAFLSEAKAFPADHPMAPAMQSFMAAVAVLRDEMADSQDEVAALAEQSVNAWIDADWAASFFELAFQPNTLPEALRDVEVIACKIYLHHGTGIVLHVVYFQGSLYCVLADAVEDVPLLDVAFPDVTARNRAVQVRTYSEAAAKKLSKSHGGDLCPLPKFLRVWEGRRKGIAGVGYGAPTALAEGGGDVAEKIREKARARAEEEARSAAVAAQHKAATPAATTSVSQTPVASTSVVAHSEPVKGGHSDDKEAEEDDDIYDMSGVKPTVLKQSQQAPSKPTPAAESKEESRVADIAPAKSYNVLGGVAKAPHHLAPLAKTEPSNRLQISSGLLAADAVAESKLADAPWDASGKPKGRA